MIRRKVNDTSRRRAMKALNAAYRDCLELDRERGNVDRDGAPTGWGELIEGLALKVRDEAFEPAGRD